MAAVAQSAAPQGVLVTASKVHVPFKAELLATIAEPRFQARPPHLVGILATKKEDARSYADVSCRRYNG
jgi:methylenetetrahydrofolate dehydrogenase (NAD+)